jgi:S1-C subfamily serine protease
MLAALPGQFVADPTFSKEKQQAALEATVRIYHQASRGEGSAVLVARQGPLVYLLTAHHIVPQRPERGNEVDLYLYRANTYPKLSAEVKAEVLARMPNEDLAVLRAVIQDPPETLRICPPPETKGMRKPFPVMTVGCLADSAPEIQFDRVTKEEVVKKPDGYEALYWQADRAQAIGRSGGPMVDKRGYVIGICSGTLHRKGYYTHISEIHHSLKVSGLSWLYEPPVRPASK